MLTEIKVPSFRDMFRQSEAYANKMRLRDVSNVSEGDGPRPAGDIKFVDSAMGSTFSKYGLRNRYQTENMAYDAGVEYIVGNTNIGFECIEKYQSSLFGTDIGWIGFVKKITDEMVSGEGLDGASDGLNKALVRLAKNAKAFGGRPTGAGAYNGQRGSENFYLALEATKREAFDLVRQLGTDKFLGKLFEEYALPAVACEVRKFHGNDDASAQKSLLDHMRLRSVDMAQEKVENTLGDKTFVGLVAAIGVLLKLPIVVDSPNNGNNSVDLGNDALFDEHDQPNNIQSMLRELKDLRGDGTGAINANINDFSRFPQPLAHTNSSNGEHAAVAHIHAEVVLKFLDALQEEHRRAMEHLSNDRVDPKNLVGLFKSMLADVTNPDGRDAFDDRDRGGGKPLALTRSGNDKLEFEDIFDDASSIASDNHPAPDGPKGRSRLDDHLDDTSSISSDDDGDDPSPSINPLLERYKELGARIPLPEDLDEARRRLKPTAQAQTKGAAPNNGELADALRSARNSLKKTMDWGSGDPDFDAWVEDISEDSPQMSGHDDSDQVVGAPDVKPNPRDDLFQRRLSRPLGSDDLVTTQAPTGAGGRSGGSSPVHDSYRGSTAGVDRAIGIPDAVEEADLRRSRRYRIDDDVFAPDGNDVATVGVVGADDGSTSEPNLRDDLFFRRLHGSRSREQSLSVRRETVTSIGTLGTPATNMGSIDWRAGRISLDNPAVDSLMKGDLGRRVFDGGDASANDDLDKADVAPVMEDRSTDGPMSPDHDLFVRRMRTAGRWPGEPLSLNTTLQPSLQLNEDKRGSVESLSSTTSSLSSASRGFAHEAGSGSRFSHAHFNKLNSPKPKPAFGDFRFLTLERDKRKVELDSVASAEVITGLAWDEDRISPAITV